MKALVTGANGFIGSAIIRELLAERHEVRGLVREGSDLRALAGTKVELIRGDVRSLESLKAAAEGCDVMFHVAAVYSYDERSSGEMVETAMRGVTNAVEAAHAARVTRFILTSSAVAFGATTSTEVRDETNSLDDNRMRAPTYYRAKAEQLRAAFICGEALGIEVAAACPTITVGPRDFRPTPSTTAILSYLKDPFKTTFPGGCNVVHVQDVARGHIAVAERGVPGEAYILGSENWEWSMFHRQVAELCGVRSPVVLAGEAASYLVGAANEIWATVSGTAPTVTRSQSQTVGRYWWYKTDKARSLGYAPRTGRAALAHALAWLVRSDHVSKRLRARLELAPEVHRAWWNEQ